MRWQWQKHKEKYDWLIKYLWKMAEVPYASALGKPEKEKRRESENQEQREESRSSLQQVGMAPYYYL